jgi:hypothetical protein
MGAVASHTPGFTSLGELWPALAFHTLASFAGVSLISKSIQRSQRSLDAVRQMKAPDAGSAS